MNNEIKQRIDQINAGQVPEGYKKEFGYITPIDWEVHRAGMVFKNISIKNNNGDMQVLSVTQDKGVVPRDEVGIDIKYDKSSLPTYKKVKKGNFIISLRSFQGGIEYSSHEGLVSPAYTVLENILPVNDYYYTCYLKTSTFISRLDSAVYGIRDGKQIGYSDFCIIPIHYPPLEEQQKIAHVLSTCDRVIELKQNLLEEKQKQKKWLMQKLWSNNKCTEVKLGEISKPAQYGAGECFAEYNSTLPRYIRITDISENGNLIDNNKVSTCVENYNQYLLNENDILFARTGATVGKTYIHKKSKIKEKEAVFAGYLIRFVIDESIAIPDYIFQYTKSPSYDEWIKSMSRTGAQPNINSQEYSSMNIPLYDLEKQKEIAQILSVADREIDLLQNELDEYKNIKKSLMQLLLTGVVRVNKILHPQGVQNDTQCHPECNEGSNTQSETSQQDSSASPQNDDVKQPQNDEMCHPECNEGSQELSLGVN